MKAGVIGVIESGQDDLSDFTDSVEINTSRFDRLNSSVQVTGNTRLPDGREAQTARAAIEDLVNEKISEINDEGKIRTYEENQKIVKTTNILFVTGSFVAVGSSAGRFAFELISQNTTNNIERIEFDIDSYVEDNSNANPWKVGFHEHIGNAKNGVVHGEQLLSDPEIANILTSAPKNQIGLEYRPRNEIIKNFVTESGYVEVFQPTNFDSGEYVDFIENELMRHAYKP